MKYAPGLPFGRLSKGQTELSLEVLLLRRQRVKSANASNPPTAPPTAAPTGVILELADCWGICDAVGETCDAVGETAPDLEAEVEVEPEAAGVKARLGLEARLANEGL